MNVDPRRELQEKLAEQERLADEIKRLRTEINVEGLNADVGLYEKVQKIPIAYDRGEKGYKELFSLCGEVMGMIGFDRAEIFEPDPEDELVEFSKAPPGLHWPAEFKLPGMEMQRGVPVVIGAQQGVGKTSCAINLALSAADRNLLTVIYSIEMTPVQIWIKLYQAYMKKIHNVSNSFSVTSEKIRKDPNELKAAREFAREAKKSIRVIEAEGFTARKICSHLDVMAGQLGRYPDYAIIDYLQIVEPEEELRRKDKKEQVDFVVKKFKGKSKRTNTIFVELSQLNRQNSFRESSEILDAAGMALVLSRKWLKDENEWEEKVKFSSIKSRFTHSLSSVVNIDGKSGAFGVEKPSSEDEDPQQKLA